jgi:hypothetical protein
MASFGLATVLLVACSGAAPVATAGPSAAQSPVPTLSPVIIYVTPAPTVAPTLPPTAAPTATPLPTPAPTPPPTPAPTAAPNYQTLSERDWKLLVKAPDDYIGDRYVVWACITQFDSATGTDSFRGQASYRKQEFWYTDGDNSFFSGDSNQLAQYVEGDIVEIMSTMLGSYTYDTTIGGSETVPLFNVDSIQPKGSNC